MSLNFYMCHIAQCRYKNETTLGGIDNKEFTLALFGIWIGIDPVQTELKNALLEN